MVARLPSDRTVTSYLTILLFLSLDKAELYSEKEPFIQVIFHYIHIRHCDIMKGQPQVPDVTHVFVKRGP